MRLDNELLTEDLENLTKAQHPFCFAADWTKSFFRK